MAKVFRQSTRETAIISKIESSKEYARRQALNAIKGCVDQLSSSVAMKLVEEQLIETTNKDGIEEEINQCLIKLGRADDFDIDYKTSPFRRMVPRPHIVSLFLTAFIIEELINYKDVIDLYGSDEDIYYCVHQQVIKNIP